jgi:hypothetical protein
VIGRRRATTNPWTSDEAVLEDVLDEQASPDELMGERVAIVGPPVPVGLDLKGRSRTLRRGALPVDGRVFVVGLHGGAGATTVTRLLGSSAALDAERTVPQHSVLERPRVLFVARTNGAGLAAARAAAQEWAAGDLDDVDLLGLVLVADGPRLSKTLRAQALAVAGLTPRCWRIEWREDWREQATPDLDVRSVRLRRVLADITQRATARPTERNSR